MSETRFGLRDSESTGVRHALRTPSDSPADMMIPGDKTRAATLAVLPFDTPSNKVVRPLNTI